MKAVLYMLSGFLLGVSLMLYDELLTYAMYCGAACKYPIPLLGTFSIYESSYLGFALAVLALFLPLFKRGKPSNSHEPA